MLLQPVKAIASTVLTALVVSLPVYGVAIERGVVSFVEDGVDRLLFNHSETRCTLDIVKNSGICETTPGVNQYSGYLSVGNNMSMWFWFFEARNAPSTAPLVLWLNGGPGCSSMIGLFQENGPCKFVNGETTPSLNPHSFNEYANMLYVDQPIGTGFSYGTESVNSTVAAAPYVWKLLQAFFALFPHYENRDFGLFTESYGGHYGPEFAHYFESQNDLIRHGHLRGEKINLIALGINNGWYDDHIQEKEFIEFSYKNSYYPLINKTIHDEYINDFETECVPFLLNCTSMTGQQQQCLDAQDACNNVDQAYGSYFEHFDPYDIRQTGDGPYFPPDTEIAYLQNPTIMKAIGAKTTYQECPIGPSYAFGSTADGMRSIISDLSSVVRFGLQTVMYAGDADAVCDWFGGLASANAVEYPGQYTFQNKPVSNYTVNGVVKGTFKTVGNLSWLRVFDSGHEVPAFQPELALQLFIQTMKKKPLFST